MNAQLADLLRYFTPEEQPEDPFQQLSGLLDLAQVTRTLTPQEASQGSGMSKEFLARLKAEADAKREAARKRATGSDYKEQPASTPRQEFYPESGPAQLQDQMRRSGAM